jgi:hypothetical protein
MGGTSHGPSAPERTLAITAYAIQPNAGHVDSAPFATSLLSDAPSPTAAAIRDSALTIVDPATPRRGHPVTIGPDANELRPGIRANDGLWGLCKAMAMLLTLLTLRKRGCTERQSDDGDSRESYALHEPISPRLKFNIIPNRLSIIRFHKTNVGGPTFTTGPRDVRWKDARMQSRRSSLLAQQPRALALPSPRLFGFAFVMQLFTTRDRQFDLRPAFGIKVELERYQCHTLPLDGSF